MKRKRIRRSAEVTIDTVESVVLRAGPEPRPHILWCPACGRHVEVVTPEQAAQIAAVNPRTVYRWMEADAVHFSEASGIISICRRSLPIRAAAACASSSAAKTNSLWRKP